MAIPSGHYEQIDGRPVVSFERTFPHSIEAVWSAITEPAQLEKWFPTTVEFRELRAGAEIDFHFAQDAYPPLHGVFREVDEPRRLALTWGEDLLTFELSPDGEEGRSCRLALTVVLDDTGKAARDSAGWESCLDMLAAALAGEPAPRPEDSGSWTGYYEHYARAGFPATAEILQ